MMDSVQVWPVIISKYGISTDSLIMTINPPIQSVNLPGNYRLGLVSFKLGLIDPLGGFLQVLLFVQSRQDIRL